MAAEVLHYKLLGVAAPLSQPHDTNIKCLQLRAFSAGYDRPATTNASGHVAIQERKRKKSQTFVFRQFSIEQDRCAMKVGTDAILLGAWADIPRGGHLALDIGAGSGVLSLMVAQRAGDLRIHAVEVEPSCAEQARENFMRSKWSDRIELKQCSIQSWRAICPVQYDLIICNPPYFKPLVRKDQLDCSDRGIAESAGPRRIARETLLLSHEELLMSVERLLSANGSFYVVIPFADAARFELLASSAGLYAVRKTAVSGVNHRGYMTMAMTRVLAEHQESTLPSPASV
eukprot:754902-Hanusia_phi.AAC.1